MVKEERVLTGTLVSLSPRTLLSALAGWEQVELRRVRLLLTGAVIRRYTPLGSLGRNVPGSPWEMLAAGGESGSGARGDGDESPRQLGHQHSRPVPHFGQSPALVLRA